MRCITARASLDHLGIQDTFHFCKLPSFFGFSHFLASYRSVELICAVACCVNEHRPPLPCSRDDNMYHSADGKDFFMYIRHSVAFVFAAQCVAKIHTTRNPPRNLGSLRKKHECVCSGNKITSQATFYNRSVVVARFCMWGRRKGDASSVVARHCVVPSAKSEPIQLNPGAVHIQPTDQPARFVQMYLRVHRRHRHPYPRFCPFFGGCAQLCANVPALA